MSVHALFSTIEELRAFAVIRTETGEQALAAGRACLRGGIRLIEITLTVPGSLDVIARLASEKDAIVGAGSIVEPAQARQAGAAGARFAVSPHFDPAILGESKAAGLLSSMGGVTPSEVMACHRAGVDVTKIFPASSFGGPAHLKALREPMPFLRLMPTGGVDESNLLAYLEAGAVGVGLGGALVDRKSIAASDWNAIEERARRIVAAVRGWRAA